MTPSLRLAESAAAVRFRQRHYLDGQGAGKLFGTAAALTAAHPWALDGFGAPGWAACQPDLQAPPPDGLRVGMLRMGGGLPLTPAVARFAGHGHVLISERGFADGARSLLQALTLRLANRDQAGYGAVRTRRSGGTGTAPERVYRFRTHRRCCSLRFGRMNRLRQDRGLCPFACFT